MKETKTFRVWTHAGITPVEVEATSRPEALAKGLALVAENPPMHPGGYFGAEYANSDGRAWVPAKPAEPIAEPYARVKPKPRAKFYGYRRY